MKDFLKANSKAIAAFVTTLILTIAAKYGFDLDINLIGPIVLSLVVYAGTYVSPANVKKEAPPVGE